MNDPRLFLIDGSGYLYRAFYGIRNLSRRDGFPTNAIFGFLKMVRKVVDEYHPEYLAMVFDAGGPTFRHRLDATYKAHRKPMPDELRVQIPIIHRLLEAYRIPLFSLSDYEADDLLASLARQAVATDLDVAILTGDKDMMQLVSPRITLLDTTKEKWIDQAEVETFWGAPPEQVIEVMGLAGDASDNIPGVPGIGQVTAAQLIREFHDLENLLANLEQIPQPKRRQNLREFAEQARRSKELARIDIHAPVHFFPEALRRQEPDWQALHDLFLEMEFSSLVREAAARQKEVEKAAPVPLVLEESPASERHYHTLIDWQAFQKFLAELNQQPAFSLDTETTGVDPVRAELVGLSFSWCAYTAFYLPVAHTPEAAPHGQLPRDAVLAALKPILENAGIAKTGQNLQYEYVLLKKYGITLAGIQRDAMLFSYLLYSAQRRHNLDVIALEELGRTTVSYAEVTGKGRNQLRFDQVPLEQAAPYACEDAEVAWEAAEKLEKQLAAIPPLSQLAQTLEIPLIPVLGEMEATGVLIDREALGELSARFSQRREELATEIFQLAGESFNINSTQQLGTILFEKMGIKGSKRTKTGFSTDVSVLTRLAEEGHPLPEKVLAYRSLAKLQSGYTDALPALINPRSGRVHTSYNQAVTLTGRLSSSDPNLQNIPIRSEEGRAIRRAFIAPPGWRLLSADYSQIELRLLAHLGQVERLREAFAQGIDIHAATAADLFGLSPTEVTPEQRRMAKTINFGLVYGMSAFGLAGRLGISNYDARRYMESYFARYPGVKEYMEEAIRLARQRGWAETIAGRRCPLREIDSANRPLREVAERTAINAPLQGSAADLIKLAMLRLDGALRQGGFRSRMILQVHDELVLEVPEEELTTIQPVVKTAMEEAYSLSVPLVVDIGVGTNWADAH